MNPLRSPQGLFGIDLMGLRDDHWLDAFALGRLVYETTEERCLTCGSSLWNRRNTGRLYCDDVCKNRHQRRKDRYRKALQAADEPCPYCGCRPG